MGGVAAVLSGVLGAVGTLQQSSAAGASAQAQADAAKQNAAVAAANADIARSEGRVAQAEAAADAYKVKGRQRAALAESGILYSPTSDILQSASDAAAEAEQLRLGRRADMEASNHLIQQSNYLTSAKGYQAQAKSSRNWLGAAGSLLGGVTQGYTYKRETGSWW